MAVEDRMQHEHSVVEEPSRVDTLLVHKYLRDPLSESLEDAEEVYCPLEYLLHSAEKMVGILIL